MNDEELIADLIATARPRTIEVRVCARGDLVDRHAILSAQLNDAAKSDDDASLAGNPAVAELSQQIVDVEAEQEASTVTFVLQSIPRRKWADLLAKHPPRPEDRAQKDDCNRLTFPPAAIVACTKSPSVSEPELYRLINDVLPSGEFGKLWTAALGLNILENPHPKLAAATELARLNGASSTTPVNAASPGPSSLDANDDQ